MNSPLKPWESSNSGHVLRSSSPNPVIPQIGSSRNVPLLPPRPTSGSTITSSYNTYSPYSGYGYSSYGSMPYGNSLYGSYGGYGNSYGYNNYGMYGMNSSVGPRDDTERRFVQFAEESSRNTFSNVESIVRAVNSISMMLDNTFFAMTSSFRAVLSVAENFGRLRNMFGHIWYSINIFRLFRWLYRKLMRLLGYQVVENATSVAWNEAHNIGEGAVAAGGSGGSNWPTIAFFGVLMSAPYLISKFLLPKYEDKYNPDNWKSPGIKAKAAFDFVATSSNELSLRTNEEILLAPTYIQEEMKLTNTGWALAVGNGKSGVVPLNYLVLVKKVNKGSVLKNSQNYNEDVPIPRVTKSNGKRVSFGENEIINNFDEPILETEKDVPSALETIIEKRIFKEPKPDLTDPNRFDQNLNAVSPAATFNNELESSLNLVNSVENQNIQDISECKTND